MLAEEAVIGCVGDVFLFGVGVEVGVPDLDGDGGGEFVSCPELK